MNSTFQKNNQVSGTYAAQPFSGKVTGAWNFDGKTALEITLDQPITVRHMGTLTVLNVEIDASGNGTGVIKVMVVKVEIEKVERGQSAAEARARCAVKRAGYAGVPASFAQLIADTYDFHKWHHRFVAELIVKQWIQQAA